MQFIQNKFIILFKFSFYYTIYNIALYEHAFALLNVVTFWFGINKKIFLGFIGSQIQIVFNMGHIKNVFFRTVSQI